VQRVTALFANDPRHRAKLIARGILVVGAVLILCGWAVTAVWIIATRQNALSQTEMLSGLTVLATLLLVGLCAYLIHEICWRVSREIELWEAHVKLQAANYNLEIDGQRRITDLKAKEAQLHDAMDHLNRVQRIAGIGSLEIDLTGKTESIIWSPYACKLFGVDPASVEPTPEYLLNRIHPDDRDKAKSASDRANSTGTAAPPLEYRIVRPDGEERILYRENAIQHDDSGKPVRRIVTYKDITEIKLTEAQLRQTQDNLNRVQRLAKVGSDVWDVRTGEVVWSDETYRIFGVDPRTFIPTSQNFLDLVIPEDRSGIVARRQELSRGKCPTGTIIRIRRPDGEVRHVYSVAELVQDKDGKPLRWVGMRQDITAQARAEQSLRDAKDAAEAANFAKSQFLANTSHELRTPLNAIIGFSEMLERGFAGPMGAKQQEYVGLVRQSGQHLLNVINDILDLAHVDSGKFELREEAEVDPQEIIDSCVALMRDRANAGNLQLSTEIESRLPHLVADPTRLKQILLNLMSNAIKFTEPGGSVVVLGRQTSVGDLVLEVRDTGPGMTPEEVDIALTPFRQVDSSHTRRHEGTGLGLPLAHRLAELHDGSLRVISKQGCGTTVKVTLPVARLAAAQRR
jgi:two-component system cell cycle sensor histidine kinase PleC